MSVEILTLIFVMITFGLYAYIGWWAKAVDTKSFYVAGNDIPTIANGAAIAADWMSAASFISMAGLIAFLGYDGTVYLMGWTGGYVLLALLLAPYLRKFGRYTVPDFIGDRYYSNKARGVAAIATIFVSLTYVAGQMRGVGIVFSRYLGVNIELGVLIGMGLIAFFAVIGGMKGITWTQVAQFVILIVAFVVPAVAISLKLTGIPVPQFAMTFSDIAVGLGEAQLEIGLKEYILPFQNMSKLNVLMMTMALMIGTAGLPHVITRFYTVKTVKSARWSAVWALLFISILYTTAPALGMFSKFNIIDTIHNKPVEEINQIEWVEKWESTGLLTLDDKSGDGSYQISGDAQMNEVGIDKDIIVLSTPEVAGLSPVIIALVAAGGLAAALSTAAGLLLAMSSAVSHDLYYKIFNRSATEKQRLRVARIMIFLSIIAAGYFGINPPGFVGEVVALAFGIAAASLFPAIFLGIFDKRHNRQGATAGIITGLVFTVVLLVLMKSVPILGTEAPIVQSFFGIDATGVGIVGMLLHFLVGFVVSRSTEEPPAEIQEMIESIRIPKGSGEPQGDH